MEDDNGNDFFDFDYDDLSDEEKAELENERKEKNQKIKNHPLYKKAWEIYEIVNAIVESLDENGKEIYKQQLLGSAMILAPKIAGALGTDSWLICMGNAAIIREHGQYLHTATSGMRLFINAEKDYVKLLRSEMEEFRALFFEWVKTFPTLDREEYEDEWGLFIRSN